MSELLPRQRVSKRSLLVSPVLFLLCVMLFPSAAQSDDGVRIGPLRALPLSQVSSILPPNTVLLIERAQIETFLASIEGTPPDWATVYGRGHHDPDHDERLFTLNRERDAAREGKPALEQLVTFVWTGELSRTDAESEVYAVFLGPELNATSWGIVRFKPEDVPSNLRAVPDPSLAREINKRLIHHHSVDVFVVMTGMLISSESIIYDFSHDEEGVGMIMPVVRLQQVDVLLPQ
ncbi:MAG: hypothetical protein OEY28_08150 [Nitrospira sp.]|nr:hypothetical protein [Nitrospira sp.]